MMKRYEVIQFLIDNYKLKSYLEIGVQNGDTFSKINIKEKIGVDPQAGYTENVMKLTSDQFFQVNQREFDIIFVDGDHSERQSMLDIRNSLNSIQPEGFVVAHDTLPHNEKYTGFEWCGTVFRAIQKINQDPRVSLITVNDDHGISILTLVPSPPGPLHLEFPKFFENRIECLNLIDPKEFNKIRFFDK